MNIFKGIFKAKPKAAAGDGSLSFNDILQLLSGVQSNSGVNVGYNNAQTVAAVFACIRVLSQSVAQLSLGLFEQTADGSTPLMSDPLYSLFHDKPNTNMTSFVWREILMQELLTKSDHVTLIQRDMAGRPIAFWPVPFETTRVFFNKTVKLIEVNTCTGTEVFIDEDVLHFP